MTLTFLIVIWAMTLAAFVALLIYRGHLAEHETRLYLYEGEPTCFHSDTHPAIRKVKIVHPVCLCTGGLTLLMTLALAGFWIAQRLS
jgi:hypothetical protein